MKSKKMLDLNQLEKKLDKALANETFESLENWIQTKRDKVKEQLAKTINNQ